MSDRMKRVLIALLFLAAFVAGGTGDYHDKLIQEKVNAEIRASAHQWAVASR